MKTTPCPSCGHPINPAAMLAILKTPAQREDSKRNGKLGGRPVGAKDSKPRKPVLFAMNRHHGTAVILEGFSCWEEVQGAFQCGIMLPDGTSANGIGRCKSVAEFHRKAAAGKIRVLKASNDTPPGCQPSAQGKE